MSKIDLWMFSILSIYLGCVGAKFFDDWCFQFYQFIGMCGQQTIEYNNGSWTYNSEKPHKFP
jgi:hypothetical protein